jgi:hypothetical protein
MACSVGTRTGNSDWRGRIWMPVNGLLIRALISLYAFYGGDFKVECPTGPGAYMTLFVVAKELSRRLSSMFLRDASGKRPVFGGAKKFQEDRHWHDYTSFTSTFTVTTERDLGPATRLVEPAS